MSDLGTLSYLFLSQATWVNAVIKVKSHCFCKQWFLHRNRDHNCPKLQHHVNLNSVRSLFGNKAIAKEIQQR